MTKQSKYLAYLAATLAGVLFLSLVVNVLVVINRETPYDVLGDYEVQSVDKVTPLSVTVTGTKCSNADTEIRIEGTVNWQRVIPPGAATTPSVGVRVALPGCTTTTFTNNVPAAVLALNQPGDVWLITGTEWPINPKTGRRGEPRTWRTENFEIPIG